MKFYKVMLLLEGSPTQVWSPILAADEEQAFVVARGNSANTRFLPIRDSLTEISQEEYNDLIRAATGT
jgi:hypothetical protein